MTNILKRDTMCGILLGLNLNQSKFDFEKTLSILTHRGPDEAGIHHQDNLLMGHTRLSIIGTQNGRQPFVSEDNQILAMVNGEIYNYHELKESLVKEGVSFNTESDCEVALHLYAKKGISFLDELDGEYAGTIVDFRSGQIHAFRDRFGVKPLFFASNATGQLAISSEIKGIFATGVVSPEISPIAIRGLLSLIQVPTVFENVQVIPPKSVLTFDLNNKGYHIPEASRYWELDFPKLTDNSDELQEKQIGDYFPELIESLEKAVCKRLQADVPLGVYLSGGLDSTTIAAIAQKHTDNPLNAFSIKFSEIGKFDESEIARRTSRHLGLNYHELEVTQQHILENLEDYVWHTELPCPNFSGVGKFMLSSLAHQHVKVVLTGEGGDELFLGYDFFRKDPDNYLKWGNEDHETNNAPKTRKRNHEKTVTSILKSIGHVPLEELKIVLSNGVQWFYKQLFSRKSRATISEVDVFEQLRQRHHPYETEDRDELTKTQIYTINNLLENYNLTILGDRAEMAHSIEGRPPFLDRELFEFAKTIPNQYKIDDQQSKVVLREAMKHYIPSEVYNGHKWPFLAPSYPFIYGKNPVMDSLMDRYLSKDALRKLGVFNHLTVKSLLLLQKLFANSDKLTLQLSAALSVILTTQIIGIKFKEEFD
ncbi:MAG: asparagine synthase (glutamine-hydrolyzing) [Pseudomonadales bacterium]|nr:asparagine synthase (glutamine-hydrolyzing) [Pseudomonadales bacterium]